MILKVSGSQPGGRAPLGRCDKISGGGRRKNVEEKTRKMKTLPFPTPCFAGVLVASAVDQ